MNGNTLKTVLLMAAMVGLLLFIGQMVGGQSGIVVAFVFSILMNLGVYWFSDKLVLMSYGAREVSEDEEPRLYRIVRRLAQQANLPMPRVYILPGASLNAFATGRNPHHSAVAATEGILRALSDDELEGVMAHELAHIKHRDILIGTIVATMAGAITFVARMAAFAGMFGGGRDRENSNPIAELALILLAPIAAMVIQFAVSRSREFAADAGGASICKKPLSLANALRKLEVAAERLPMETAGQATAHLFIVNPLRGGGILKLFSTHPPTEERIARLQELAMSGKY
jgi:heat shock protein HtpX